MYSKSLRGFFYFIYFLAVLSLCGCVMEARGIPVKTYRPPAEDAALYQKQQKEMLEDIAGMRKTKENTVFTERKGFPEYIIGPGDVLTLNYWMPYSSFSMAPKTHESAEGFTLTTFNVTVRPDGKISYSFGDDIRVAGYTPSEVREILLRSARHYIRHPRIEVNVKEYKSKTALLVGQVNNLQTGVSGPGKYPLTGKTTVLDLIISAGGPIMGRAGGGLMTYGRSDYWGGTANGDLQRVELVRNGKKYTLNLYTTMFQGETSQNVFVENGDVITVPEEATFAKRVFVFGQVLSPGVFRLRDVNDILTAMSVTGGTTPVAVKSDIKIIREYKERQGRPVILSVNLDEILKQGDLTQNVPLQDGDLVYVPRSVIGDINEFIANIMPLIDFINFPAREFRSTYLLNQDAFKF
jgi:protein involved in polysaccharide export with SLBB domain